jgi:hypothetical protein
LVLLKNIEFIRYVFSMSPQRKRSVIAFVGSLAVISAPLCALFFPIPAFAVNPPPTGAIIVNNGTAPDQSALPPACTNPPPLSTIAAAVAAAVVGSQIYVCAGTYSEAVSLPTDNLTLLGAQFDVTAVSDRTDPNQETTIVAPTGNTITYSGANTGTINGFTIIGNNAGAGDNNGIVAIADGQTGFTWTNNIITGTTSGISFTATGSTPTTIQGNRIVGNNEGGGSQGSNGIVFTNGPANNVTIENNQFGNQTVDINTTGAGDGATLSTNLIIRANASRNSSSFVTLFLTDNALINSNAAEWTAPTDTNAGSTIGIFGGNIGTTISDNAISGGAASGIQVEQLVYGVNSAITISTNAIRNRLNGIQLNGLNDSASLVSNNAITNSGVGDTIIPGAGGNGLWVGSGSQIQVTENAIEKSVIFDCLDQTTGSGTAGTANTWTSNIGTTSSPPGLCAIPPIPPHPVVPVTHTLAATGATPWLGFTLAALFLIPGVGFALNARRTARTQSS